MSFRASIVVLVAAAWVATAAASVDIREARAQRCTRAGIATSLMAYTGLMNEGRFAATKQLWLPRPRLEYAYMLYVAANGGLLSARLGAEISARSAQWLASGGTRIDVAAVDPRPNAKEPRRTGFALWWIRATGDGSRIVLGSAKGVWDCEVHRIGRIVGSEQRFETEESARADAGSHCGRRGSSTIRRYGQTAVLCGPNR